MDSNPRIIYYLLLVAVALGVALLVPRLLPGSEPKDESASASPQQKARAPEAPAGSAEGASGAAADNDAADARESDEDADSPGSAVAPVLDEAARERRLSEQEVVTLETAEYEADISDLNAGLTSFRLTRDRYVVEGEPIDVIEELTREEFFPLRVEVDGVEPPREARWQPQRLEDGGVRLSWQDEGVSIARKYESGGPYQLWATTSITNRSEHPRTFRLHMSAYRYVTREQESGGVFFLPVRSPELTNGLCHHVEEVERLDRKELLEPHVYRKGIRFAGVESVYFLTAIAPNKPQARSCRLVSSNRGRDAEGEPLGSLFAARLSYEKVELAPGATRTYRALAYIGPKTHEDLTTAGHSLTEAIDLGFFASISGGLTWLLRAINTLVSNWGVAIILLTLLVKIVLYPLTEKSFRSMARMQLLKPEMDRINELYADDREKKGAAIMEMYRKEGINPLGGCLPQLLQLPIWFALYTSLSTNVELFRAPFVLWWQDLSQPDPYFALPLALGLLMFVQQKITPSTMDPVQAKMMLYMMPTMITSFMLFLPAGLCLYMFTNSALSIAQQRFVQSRLGQQQASKEAAVVNSNPPESPPPETSPATAGASARGSASRSKPAKSKRRSRRGRR